MTTDLDDETPPKRHGILKSNTLGSIRSLSESLTSRRMSKDLSKIPPNGAFGKRFAQFFSKSSKISGKNQSSNFSLESESVLSESDDAKTRIIQSDLSISAPSTKDMLSTELDEPKTATTLRAAVLALHSPHAILAEQESNSSMGSRWLPNRTTVSASSLKEQLDCVKLTLQPIGNRFTNPLHQTFVKSYYPIQFESIRYSLGVTDDVIQAAFSESLKRTGAGRSGSVMFWTSNKSFILKSLTKIEIEQMKKMSETAYPDYIHSQPNTLLAKYLGFYRIQFNSFSKPVYFVLMLNAFGLDAHSYSEMYDLKGSRKGRILKEDIQDGLVPSKSISIKKDKNFLKEGRWLYFLSGREKSNFLSQLQDDVTFLRQQQVLDYSLLVGINKGLEWRTGIIDILTPYSPRKALEHAVMGSIHGKENISCNPPDAYGQRFLHFIRRRCFALSTQL